MREVTHAHGWAEVTRDGPHSEGNTDLPVSEQMEAEQSHTDVASVPA